MPRPNIILIFPDQWRGDCLGAAGHTCVETPFLDELTNVLEPGVVRNAEEGSTWTKIDFRFDVGIPIFSDADRLAFFMIIDNLTNLLNDDWGILKQHAFPYAVEEGTPEPRIGDASRYEIRFGLRYDF